MSKLPGMQDLAILVSNVTGTMFGATFAPVDRMIRGESICEQMVMIRIAADPEIIVVLSVDTRAGHRLSAAFLGHPDHEISPRMIDDVTAHLLTVVASQISRFLDIAQPPRVPQRTTLAELVRDHGTLDFDEAILLRSQGDLDVGLWILEERSGGAARPRSSSPNGLLRFLLRTMGPRRSRAQTFATDHGSDRLGEL